MKEKKMYSSEYYYMPLLQMRCTCQFASLKYSLFFFNLSAHTHNWLEYIGFEFTAIFVWLSIKSNETQLLRSAASVVCGSKVLMHFLCLLMVINGNEAHISTLDIKINRRIDRMGVFMLRLKSY